MTTCGGDMHRKNTNKEEIERRHRKFGVVQVKELVFSCRSRCTIKRTNPELTIVDAEEAEQDTFRWSGGRNRNAVIGMQWGE
jgi:hypothetical protein